MLRVPVYRLSFATLALSAAALAASPALAQRGGGGGGGGGFGATSRQGNVGATGTSSRLPFGSGGRQAGRTNGMSSTSMSDSAFGSGGMGSAFGANGGQGMGSAFGQAGAGQMTQGLGQDGTGGQPFQEGGFVGRDAEDVRGSFQSTSGRERRGMMFDMMVENLNEMRESRRRSREQNMPPPPVRVRLQPAFDLPVAAPSSITGAQMQVRINRVLATRGIGAAQIQIDGRTAVLSGSVSSARDRALVERLAKLEPGISQVENLLTVVAPEQTQP